MKKIITIGREFGSGGREVGRRLAEELGIAYYDREILTELAKRTSFTEDYIRQIDEQKPTSLFPITISQSFYSMNATMLSQNQAIFLEQSNIINDMAKRSSCVIVGRCADIVLEEMNPFRIFVYADMESRLLRCRLKAPEQENLTDRELKKKIVSIDKNRAAYYEYYSGKKWGDRLNYDLCLNTSKIEIKEFIPVLAKMFKE